MISFLVGTVESSSENFIELDVNGVGYELIATQGAVAEFSNQKVAVKVHTYLAVREDAVSLFGFKDNNEKALFLKLITVSGVGPKLAITILSGISADNLCLAIASGDITSLSKIKGLGKKTAEKIVLELKDKVGAIDSNSQLSGLPLLNNQLNADAVADATQVLCSLGYSTSDAGKLISKVATAEMNAEDIIKMCLKEMSK